MAGNTSNVRTLHVAMKILNEMAKGTEPCRVSTLARSLDMTPPRVSRHLSTLRQLGLVHKSGYDESYILGRRLITLGQVAAQQNTPVLTAEPHMDQLREITQGAVVLSMKSRDDVTAILCLDSQGSPITIHVAPGLVFKGPQSPTVRVFLAYGSDEDVDKFVEQHKEAGLLSSKAKITGFRNKVSRARVNGYDFENDAHGYGASGLSAPVLNFSGAIVACITLILPSSRMQSPPRKEYLQALIKSAADVSAALGYSPEE